MSQIPINREKSANFNPDRAKIDHKNKESEKKVPLRVPHFDKDFNARKYNF